MSVNAIEKLRALMNTDQRKNPDPVLTIKYKNEYKISIHYMGMKVISDHNEVNNLMIENIINKIYLNPITENKSSKYDVHLTEKGIQIIKGKAFEINATKENES